MIRVDYKTRARIAEPIENEIIRAIVRQLRQTDIVLVSDYDKGVCTPRLLASLIAAAGQAGIRTLVDPLPGSDYRKYHGCSAITPNRLGTRLPFSRALAATP